MSRVEFCYFRKYTSSRRSPAAFVHTLPPSYPHTHSPSSPSRRASAEVPHRILASGKRAARGDARCLGRGDAAAAGESYAAARTLEPAGLFPSDAKDPLRPRHSARSARRRARAARAAIAAAPSPLAPSELQRFHLHAVGFGGGGGSAAPSLRRPAPVVVEPLERRAVPRDGHPERLRSLHHPRARRRDIPRLPLPRAPGRPAVRRRAARVLAAAAAAAAAVVVVVVADLPPQTRRRLHPAAARAAVVAPCIESRFPNGVSAGRESAAFRRRTPRRSPRPAPPTRRRRTSRGRRATRPSPSPSARPETLSPPPFDAFAPPPRPSSRVLPSRFFSLALARSAASASSRIAARGVADSPEKPLDILDARRRGAHRLHGFADAAAVLGVLAIARASAQTRSSTPRGSRSASTRKTSTRAAPPRSARAPPPRTGATGDRRISPRTVLRQARPRRAVVRAERQVERVRKSSRSASRPGSKYPRNAPASNAETSQKRCLAPLHRVQRRRGPSPPPVAALRRRVQRQHRPPGDEVHALRVPDVGVRVRERHQDAAQRFESPPVSRRRPSGRRKSGCEGNVRSTSRLICARAAPCRKARAGRRAEAGAREKRGSEGSEAPEDSDSSSAAASASSSSSARSAAANARRTSSRYVRGAFASRSFAPDHAIHRRARESAPTPLRAAIGEGEMRTRNVGGGLGKGFIAGGCGSATRGAGAPGIETNRARAKGGRRARAVARRVRNLGRGGGARRTHLMRTNSRTSSGRPSRSTPRHDAVVSNADHADSHRPADAASAREGASSCSKPSSSRCAAAGGSGGRIAPRLRFTAGGETSPSLSRFARASRAERTPRGASAG